MLKPAERHFENEATDLTAHQYLCYVLMAGYETRIMIIS